jgi:phosphatidylglycerol:prolipoprotein diacylglycerol transferase
MLFTVFGVPSYAIVQLGTVLLFCALVLILFRRAGIPRWHAGPLTVLYVLCNFVAAKMLFDYVKDAGAHTFFTDPPLEHYRRGGLWGWPIVFLPCAFLYPFVCGVRQRVLYFRALAFTLPPVLALQKVACLLAGCCHGRPTTLPWGVVFPADSLCATPGVPLHPLQVYDGLLALAILGVQVVVDRAGGAAGRPLLFPLFVGLYALARFGTEFLRPEADGGLLASQWVELAALVAVGGFLLLGQSAWQRLLTRPVQAPYPLRPSP